VKLAYLKSFSQTWQHPLGGALTTRRGAPVERHSLSLTALTTPPPSPAPCLFSGQPTTVVHLLVVGWREQLSAAPQEAHGRIRISSVGPGGRRSLFQVRLASPVVPSQLFIAQSSSRPRKHPHPHSQLQGSVESPLALLSSHSHSRARPRQALLAIRGEETCLA